MPQTKSQRAVFALLTVIITVHVYVFYSLYVIHGVDFMARTNTGSVLAAIDSMGGVMMLGTRRPIWALVAIGMMRLYAGDDHRQPAVIQAGLQGLQSPFHAPCAV